MSSERMTDEEFEHDCADAEVFDFPALIREARRARAREVELETVLETTIKGLVVWKTGAINLPVQTMLLNLENRLRFALARDLECTKPRTKEAETPRESDILERMCDTCGWDQSDCICGMGA